jgi:hypothetical protein
MDVLLEGPPDYSAEAFFEPTACFALDIVDEVAVEAAVVGCAKDVDLEGVFVCESVDECFFIGAETFHSFATFFCGCCTVPSYLLRGTVA